MEGHIHAKLMAEYAKDAATHEKPWELWQRQANHVSDFWFTLVKHPAWASFTGLLGGVPLWRYLPWSCCSTLHRGLVMKDVSCNELQSIV